MEEKVLFAGFGGQGILAAGRIFADACIASGLNASWLPSYGPEMRGGTCNCQVVAAEGQILSPIFTRPTTMVIMNQASLDRFSASVHKTKLIVLNSGLADYPAEFVQEHQNIKLIKINATDLALELGSPRSANMVMLGALAKHSDVLDIDELKKAVAATFAGRTKIIEANLKAVDSGYENAKVQ